MNRDLRTFLREMNDAGRLLTVSKPVAIDFEIQVIQQKLARLNRYPALYFERVKGFPNPVVSGLFGSYELLQAAIGAESRHVLASTFLEKSARSPGTVLVPPEQAPVKEVKYLGDEVDLTRLPIGQHAEGDSGKYITIGCLVCKDPDTGVTNIGVYRHELKGERRLGCMINPANDGAYVFRKHKERNLPMEVAIFIRDHPAVIIGALAKNGLDHSEYDVMAGLLGEPLELVQGETVDLPVPAWAEIVIEGVIRPEIEERDGPFGEYQGYYGPPRKVPVIEVTAVTMRRDAVFHDLDPAHREHFMSGLPGKEGQILTRVKQVVPSVKAVCLPPSGCCLYHIYLSISKRVPGEGRYAGLAALGCNHNFKHVIVVDDDVDVYNEEEVLWALATRFEADKDCTFLPFTLGAHLDPTSYGESRSNEGPMTTKVIFDATRPVQTPFAERVRPPVDVWDAVRLEDYLGGADSWHRIQGGMGA